MILDKKKKIIKELEEKEDMLPEKKLKDIIKITDEFLKMEQPEKTVFERLIKKIEFDKEKNIKITFSFFM